MLNQPKEMTMTTDKLIQTYTTEKILAIIGYLQNEQKKIDSYSARFGQLSNDLAPLFAEMERRTHENT